MTPNDIITYARRLIQDNQLLRTTEDYIDATLLDYVNQTLRQTVVFRPDLFTLITDIPTTPDVVQQTMPADSMRLTDLFSVKGGNAITEVSRETLDRSAPGWTQVAAGTPVNWMRHIKNPNQFFLYPRPQAAVELVGEYVQGPPNYTVNQTINLLSDTFLPAVATGVVSMVFSAQGPNNDMNVANSYLERYTQMMGVSLQTRPITDTRESGFDPRQVI
jgi:hypothetical protein